MGKTIKLPVDLGPQGYVRFVRKVTEGCLAATFLAQVVYEGELRRAYIKIYDQATQPKAIINEVLGYLCAQALGLPSPPVFFVEVPPSDVVASGLPMPTSATRAVATLEAHNPAVAGEGSAKTFFEAGSIDLSYIKQRLLSSPAGRTLIAFDEAIGNGDRNIGNIVFSWKHGVVAIDHGCILTGHSWSVCSLNSSVDGKNIAFDIVNHTPIGNSDKGAVFVAAQVMLEAYYAAMSELKIAMAYPSDSELSAAFDFVWWKVQRLEKRMATLLQLVI